MVALLRPSAAHYRLASSRIYTGMSIQVGQAKAAAMLAAEQAIASDIAVLKLPGVNFMTRMQLMSAITDAICSLPRKTEVALPTSCDRLSDETIALAVNEYIASFGKPPHRILVWCRRARGTKFLCIETILAPNMSMDTDTEALLRLPFTDSAVRSKFVSVIDASIRTAPKTTVVDLGDCFGDAQPSKEEVVRAVGGYTSAKGPPACQIVLRCERVGTKQMLIITVNSKDNTANQASAAGGDGSDE